MKLIAILPARSTSKRLPNKNFRNFFGRPIIEWVIDEIKKSEIFDKIVISTDAIIYNLKDIQPKCEKPINTSNEIIYYQRKNPTYEQTVDDVCLEVLQEYPDYDYMMVAYPCAYAVTWQHICKSFKYMTENLGKTCVSIGMLNGKFELDNGGIYWHRLSEKIAKFNFNMACKYEMPMVDINTLQDFCEAKLHALTLADGRLNANNRI